VAGVYSTVIVTLGFFTVVVFAAGLFLLASMTSTGNRARVVSTFRGWENHPIIWGFSLALVASGSSLYLSETVGLVPCQLCWYQRIAMYPLVLLLGSAAIRRDIGVWRYGLPLSVIGLAISIYHITIQWKPALDIGTCATGAPCTGRYLSVFGFISIPTMAGSVFLALTALMLLLRQFDSASDIDAPAQTGLITDP
tara:strand:+ start:1435 stop:2022 length:588 start_codon:yes stop_codon:yes gene_type:complete